ncbi:transketolase C-terminal domain-containing protein [Caulobacter segnis]
MPAIVDPLEIGKGRIVREGTSVAIVSFGARLSESLKAADLLAARGLSAIICDAPFRQAAGPRPAAAPGPRARGDRHGGRRLDGRLRAPSCCRRWPSTAP